MKDRVANILNIVKTNTHAVVESARASKSVCPGIYGFVDAGEEAFILQTNYADYGQQTRLEFEEGYVFYIRLIHFFGYLHPQKGINANQLLGLLVRNSGSDSHVAIKVVEGTHYATLCSTGYYLESESDENIAEAFSTQLSGLIMDLVIDLPKIITQLGIEPFQPYFGPDTASVFGPTGR